MLVPVLMVLVVALPTTVFFKATPKRMDCINSEDDSGTSLHASPLPTATPTPAPTPALAPVDMACIGTDVG